MLGDVQIVGRVTANQVLTEIKRACNDYDGKKGYQVTADHVVTGGWVKLKGCLVSGHLYSGEN